MIRIRLTSALVALVFVATVPVFAADADDTGPVEWELTGDTITGSYTDGVKMVVTNGSWPLHVRFKGTEGWVHVDDDGGIDAEPKSLLAQQKFGKGYPAEGHYGAVEY